MLRVSSLRPEVRLLRRRGRRSYSGLGGAALALVGAWLSLGGAAGCSSESTQPACTPGEISSCAGPQGCTGEQVCSEDGSRFEECSCGLGTASNDPSEGAGGSAGSGTMMAAAGSMGGGTMTMDAVEEGGEEEATTGVRRSVGAHCAQDSDCTGELTCVTEGMAGIFGEGGPPRGYCTAPCTREVGCAAHDPLASCEGRDAEGNGFCFAACLHGNGGDARCVGPEGARFQACVQTQGVDLCVPRCLSDEDCAEGGICDLGAGGGCLAEPRLGGGVGAECTIDTALTDCQSGLCLELIDGGGFFCSGFCSIDLVAGCGFADEVAQRGAACLQPDRPNATTGDLGLCFELCDVAEDCIQAGSICDPFRTTQEIEVWGRAGVCEPG